MLTKGGFSVSEDADLLFKELDFQQTTIIGIDSNGNSKIIRYDDIFLIESFAHKVEVHTTSGKYLIKERLYEIEGIYESQNIIRINKSQIVPKEKIFKIIPQYNSRLKLLLNNKVVVFVTRMYLVSFREKIGM